MDCDVIMCPIGELYIAGGSDCDDNNRVLSSVEKYSFATGKWQRIQDMNQPRMSHSLVSSHGKNILCFIIFDKLLTNF